MRSIIEASVVDFPLPVVPVTRIKPPLFHGDLLDYLRQQEFIDGGYTHWNNPEDEPHSPSLLKDVASEPSQARYTIGKIHIILPLEKVRLSRGHNRKRYLRGIVISEFLF